MTNNAKPRPTERSEGGSTADSRDRGKLPSRGQVEQWLALLLADIEHLYDAEIGKCGPYRWARSGLDTMKSGARDVSGGEVSNPTRDAALQYKVSDVRRAGWLIKDATMCIQRARLLLTPKEGRPLVDGPVLPGWVSRAEMAQLKQKQWYRQAKGQGYGDA